MSTVSMRDALVIVGKREALASLAAAAVATYGERVASEIAAFDAARDGDADGWARLTAIKAILSPGAKLDGNIAAANRAYAAMISGWTPPAAVGDNRDDMFAAFRELWRGTSYGSVCYGQNVVNLAASWEGIRSLTADVMTWEGLTALREAGVIHGQGEKVRSWHLALFDATSRVVTLDRHMLRAMCDVAGVARKGEISAKGAAYEVLAALMLDIADGLGVDPLVLQWSLWCLWRGDDFASHLALVQG